MEELDAADEEIIKSIAFHVMIFLSSNYVVFLFSSIASCKFQFGSRGLLESHVLQGSKDFVRRISDDEDEDLDDDLLRLPSNGVSDLNLKVLNTFKPLIALFVLFNGLLSRKS